MLAIVGVEDGLAQIDSESEVSKIDFDETAATSLVIGASTSFALEMSGAQD